MKALQRKAAVRMATVSGRQGAVCIVALALAAGTAEAKPHYPPDTTLTRVPTPPGIPRPDYLQPSIDPSFGTTVTRIADRVVFHDPDSRSIRHAYSKNQAWNADGSLLMLSFHSDAPLLDGDTYELLGRVHEPFEAVWLNTDPAHMLGVRGTSLIEWDARADRRSAVLHHFPGYRRIDLGASEGNLSNDDRYAALFGVRGGRDVDILVYDLVADQVVSRRSFPHSGIEVQLNNVTMSQSGDRVIVEFNGYGNGPRRGIVSYDRHLSDRVHLSKQGATHFDACVDSTGAESIVVGADDSSTIVSTNLKTGRVTRLLPKGVVSAFHISCRNLDRPGWAYISHYFSHDELHLLNFDEVFAVKLDGSGTVERFAHEYHSKHVSYAREPQAVPSRDGSRVLWASDWQRPQSTVYAYVAEQK